MMLLLYVTSMLSCGMWQSIRVHLFLQRRLLTHVLSTTTTTTTTMDGSAPAIIMITIAVFGLEEAEDQGTQTSFSVGEQSRTFHSVVTSPTQHSSHTITM